MARSLSSAKTAGALTSGCKHQRSLVKRQLQPHLTPFAARSGQSLEGEDSLTAPRGHSLALSTHSVGLQHMLGLW